MAAEEMELELIGDARRAFLASGTCRVNSPPDLNPDDSEEVKKIIRCLRNKNQSDA